MTEPKKNADAARFEAIADEIADASKPKEESEPPKPRRKRVPRTSTGLADKVQSTFMKSVLENASPILTKNLFRQLWPVLIGSPSVALTVLDELTLFFDGLASFGMFVDAESSEEAEQWIENMMDDLEKKSSKAVKRARDRDVADRVVGREIKIVDIAPGKPVRWPESGFWTDEQIKKGYKR